MAPLRIAIAGLALTLIAALPLPSILHRGRLHPRGPWPAVSRRERPVRFWTTILGHMVVVGFGLVLLGFGVGRWVAGQ